MLQSLKWGVLVMGGNGLCTGVSKESSMGCGEEGEAGRWWSRSLLELYPELERKRDFFY